MSATRHTGVGTSADTGADISKGTGTSTDRRDTWAGPVEPDPLRAGPAEAGPVQVYAARLAAALRGPAKGRARLVEEIHGGLMDTADAYVQAGVAPEEADRRAVRDFGPVEKVARACQGELTLAQTRHTARVAALSVPLLLACCYLTRSVGVLTAPLATLAVVSAVLAGATLLTTGVLARWMPIPGSLPSVVAWTGTATSVVLALTTLSLATAALMAALPS